MLRPSDRTPRERNLASLDLAGRVEAVGKNVTEFKPLSETAAAIRYVRGGHAKAKVVVTM